MYFRRLETDAKAKVDNDNAMKAQAAERLARNAKCRLPKMKKEK